MAEAPSGDTPLKTDEAVDILEEILEAQNVSYVLGLKLKLPQHVVEAIHSTHLRPRERLLHVLIEFTRLAEPRPTWRVIVDALRTPAVNLPRLADKVEAAHFQNLSSVRDLVAQTPGALSTTSSASTSQHKANPLPSPVSIFERSVTTLRGEIRGFHRRFNTLKESTIQCLETCHIAVMTVVYMLTSILAVDEHKVFLEEKHRVLYECNHHLQLFGLLNLYWNYLAYDLLDQLIEELTLKNEAFEDIAGQMATYKNDLQLFRENTPLDLFCQAVPAMEDDPPPGFRKVVVKFNWPNTVTLEDVERFRIRYAQMYDLKKCAMMLNVVRRGSFKVTWFVPLTIVKILRKEISPSVFVQFNVSTVVVAGHSVYRKPVPQPTQVNTTIDGGEIAESPQEEHLPDDEDYHFVGQPSDDFFCPVTYGLLLQPHLTSCCGKHLSQEAVTRIQREGGACPLCKTANLNTVLNKHFQRQVNELRVFCRHEARGCRWKGEICEFQRHILSCCIEREGEREEEVVELQYQNISLDYLQAQLGPPYGSILSIPDLSLSGLGRTSRLPLSVASTRSSLSEVDSLSCPPSPVVSSYQSDEGSDREQSGRTSAIDNLSVQPQTTHEELHLLQQHQLQPPSFPLSRSSSVAAFFGGSVVSSGRQDADDDGSDDDTHPKPLSNQQIIPAHLFTQAWAQASPFFSDPENNTDLTHSPYSFQSVSEQAHQSQPDSGETTETVQKLTTKKRSKSEEMLPVIEQAEVAVSVVALHRQTSRSVDDLSSLHTDRPKLTTSLVTTGTHEHDSEPMLQTTSTVEDDPSSYGTVVSLRAHPSLQRRQTLSSVEGKVDRHTSTSSAPVELPIISLPAHPSLQRRRTLSSVEDRIDRPVRHTSTSYAAEGPPPLSHLRYGGRDRDPVPLQQAATAGQSTVPRPIPPGDTTVSHTIRASDGSITTETLV